MVHIFRFFLLILRKKVILAARGFTPPPPLSGSAYKKSTFFSDVFPKVFFLDVGRMVKFASNPLRFYTAHSVPTANIDNPDNY